MSPGEWIMQMDVAAKQWMQPCGMPPAQHCKHVIISPALQVSQGHLGVLSWGMCCSLRGFYSSK